jgi:autotransporter-associated beta strand protein
MKPTPNLKALNPMKWLLRRSIKDAVQSSREPAFSRGPVRTGLTTLCVAAVAGAVLLTPSAARASLIAYEGFNYAAGSGNLTGQAGGFGWGGLWQSVVGGSSSVQAGSLSAVNAPSGYNSLSIGNAAFTPNGTRTGRFLDTSATGPFGQKGYLNGNGFIGASGKTIYISFIQQPDAANNNYYEFEFHRGDLNDPGRIGGVGNDTSGSSSVYLRTPSAAQTAIGAGSAAATLYVVRIDFLGGNDTVYVYQNPTSSTEPGTPTLLETSAGDMSFNGISLGAFANGRTVVHDEVRVGETWSDVVSPAGTYSTGVWDGGGSDNNWSTVANWDNNTLPPFPILVTFDGNTRLANNNDLTGISVNGITFDAAAGAFTLSGNSLGLNGNIGFSANPAAPITQTINLPLTPTSDFGVNTTTNGNLVLNGGITSGNILTKSGAGTFTLGGTSTVSGFNTVGGTNILTGNLTVNSTGGQWFYLANGGTRGGVAGCASTLIIPNGAVLTVTGTYADAGVIGRDGGTGTVIQNGGTFNFAVGNNNSLFVGASGAAGTHSEYDMNGGVLDMSGNTLGIALGANVAITCAVNQTGGVITNVGTLSFDPFFTQGHGIYNLTGGAIYLESGGMTVFSGGGYDINLGGGTVGAEGSWISPLNLTLSGSNGPVTFNPAGNTILLSGNLSGPGGLTVSGGGTLELSGANTYTGDTTITAGSTLQLDTTGSSAGAIRIANGGSLNLNFGGNFVFGSLYTNGVALPVGTYNGGNLPGFLVGSGNVQVTSGISTGLWTGLGGNNNWSTAGNWDNNAVPIFPRALTFGGTSQLNNNNDLDTITISGITFNSAAGAFVLNGNDVTLSGNIGFSANPAAPITQTINLNMALNGDKTIDTPTNGNLTLGGNISGPNSKLTKNDAGTLTLSGSDSFAGYILNGGTNIITGNVSVSGTSGSVLYLGNGDTNDNGTLVIQSGASLTMSGNFDDAFVIGRDGGSGRVIQNGGTFNYSNPNHTDIFIGATSHPGTQAEYDMNGGILEMNGETLGVALGDSGVAYTGILNQTGGSINGVFNLDLGAVRATGRGVYNLSGGSITIDFGGITSDSGSYAVNLGGGTIAASSSWASPLNMNLTNLNGSVTFNMNGNIITLSGILSGNGGLIVGGPGTLELSRTNTYTGDTVVSQGVLQLDAAGSLPSAIRIVDNALLNLNFTDTLNVIALYTNGVALPSGTYSAANLPQFIQGTGSVRVTSLIFSTEPQNQVVYLNKGQSATLTSGVTGGSATYQWYLNNSPVAGATGSTLMLSGLQITNGGNYYVVATGGSGSVTSSVAAVTIYAINNNLFVYDGFAYPAGSVDGSSQNGGFGWNGPWQQTDGTGVIIAAGNLVGGANVPAGYDSRSISNCIEVPSNAQTRSGRFFDCSSSSQLSQQGFVDANGNLGADGKTIYLSFLQQPDRTSGFYELEFHKGNLSDPGRIGGIGNDAGGNTVNLRAPNGVNNRSLGAGSTAPNLYVVRIDYKAGNDDVFVYRNPTSGTEPATPTLVVSNVADMSFNGVSAAAYNGPDVKHDEIRLGATWADAIGLAVSNLLPPVKTANGFSVQFAATPGYTYRIQRATSLTGPWTDISTNAAPTDAFIQFEDTNAPAGNAFYRTVTP